MSVLGKSELYDADKEVFWHPSRQMAEYADQIIFDRGEGYTLWDLDGNEYIDANSGVWCVHLGYSETRLVEAAAHQLARLPYASLSAFSHAPAATLAKRLADLSPTQPAHVLFATSGAEAVEVSIKLARQYHRQRGDAQRTKIVALKRSYHGLTYGALATTGLSSQRRQYEPLPPGFSHVEAPYCYRCPWGRSLPHCGYPCVSAIEEAIEFEGSDNIAAIIVEPILASGGMIVPPDGYLSKVSECARKAGALFVVDEITTGMGRTGALFYSEGSMLKPDILLLSKGLTSGYQPLSAIITNHKVYEAFLGSNTSGKAFLDFHTFGGHPAACAVAIEVLCLLEERKILEHVNDMSTQLLKGLLDLKRKTPAIGDVRGAGLMWGIEFSNPETGDPLSPDTVRRISQVALKRGLIVRPIRDAKHVLCLFPPLVIDSDGIVQILTRLGSSIHDVLESE